MVRLLFWLGFIGIAVALFGYRELVSTPREVTYEVALPGWTARPVRILLLSDIHVIAPDMPPSRVRRIVSQANAQQPDIILIAGDIISRRLIRTGHMSVAESIAPLAGLKAPLGVHAVLGNHDMEYPGLDLEVETALRRAGVGLLRNSSVMVRDFRVAGVDDGEYGTASVADALAGWKPGEPVLFLVHNPDVAVQVPPAVPLILAGHTHGGQVALPYFGPIVTGTQLGWTRGVLAERGRTVVVTSGLGASMLPIRIGVPPEIVVVELSGR